MTRDNRKTLLATALAATTALVMPATAFANAETLTVDLVNEPSSLDPHRQWNPDSYYVYRNIFDNMVTRSDDGEIVPKIATSWEYESDTEILFTIRDDVTFHNGDPLTAEDVVYSVERITDPDFASPQLSQFDSITEAEVVDDTRVRLTTAAPYSALMPQLVKLSIVPQDVVEEMGDEAFNLAPVGSGPYEFVEWQRGVQVTLDRNEDYWGDAGTFEEAVFRAVPDAATRIANLRSGSADLVVSLNSDLAMQLDGVAGVAPRSVLTERVGFLKLNPQKPGLEDVRLRRAVGHAIDRDIIVEGLLGGFDAPVPIMLSPAHFGWIEGFEGTQYDPEAARALIDEMGEAADRQFSFATAPVFDQRIVQALQQMLADVGLDVEIEMTDMSTYLGKVRSEPTEGPDFSFGRWSCACQDADGVLHPLMHSSSSWSAMRNDEIDAALDAARRTLDEQERLDNYRIVHEFTVDQVPLVPLYQAAIIYGADERLDWTPTANESMFINRMSWSE